MSITLKPAETKKASVVIYEQIQDMITSGELKPGDKLPSERKMMEMTQRSRPTIREALRMLENADLIRTVPGGGAVVKELGSKSVEKPLENMLMLNQISGRELLEFRELNEVAIARWAAERRTDEDLAQMEECLHDAQKHLSNADQYLQMDVKFHSLIAKAAHNRMAEIVETVIHQMVCNLLLAAYNNKDESHRKKMFKSIAASHEEIYLAIKDGDLEKAQESMRRHLGQFESDVLLEEKKQQNNSTK